MSLFRLGGKVPERTGIGTIIFLVSGADQHLNPPENPSFKEEEILVRVLILRLNLNRVEISKRQSIHKVNGNQRTTFL